MPNDYNPIDIDFMHANQINEDDESWNNFK